MKSLGASNYVRYAARSLVVLALTLAAAQNSTTGQQLPDSPGAIHPQAQVAQASTSESTPQSGTQQQQTQTREPVGTAAAEAPVTTGVAGSEPAGAAIAPAKQRRVRTLLIKVGALLGAGAAIGTVAALSSASPSRPPGTR
jgi:hypothetical protein